MKSFLKVFFCQNYLKKKINIILIFLALANWVAIAQDEDYNHPELNWKTIETEHFLIHFHEGTERTAREVAGIAESIYKPITELYNHEPDQRVNIVIRDHDDYSNGAAFFYDNKIEIRSPALDYELRGVHPWLWNVVTHEFTHIVQIQTTMKFSRRIPAFYIQWLGYEAERRPDVLYGYPNVIVSYPFSGFVLPAWFAEGTAQYNNPNLDYDYWDTHRDMILRMYILDGNLLSWEEMSIFGKNSLGNESVYNAGFSLVEYISKKYGVEKLKEISAKLSAPFCLTINKAIESSLGISGEELYGLWQQDKLQEYKNLSDSLQPYLTKEDILENEGFGNFYPAISPDGSKLAYVSNKNKDYLSQSSIYLLDLATKKSKMVLPAVRSSVSFSPDGRYLYYSKITRSNPFWSGYGDLYRYDILKEKEERLTYALRALNPSISPDGKRLAFTFGSDGTLNLGIYDIEEKKTTKLTNFANGEQVYTPSWSKDGKRIAFGYSTGHNQSIAIIDADGTNLKILSLPGDARNPHFGSDTLLFFSWDRGGIFNIYCMNMATGALWQKTQVLGGAFLPNYYSYGNLIYVTYTSTGYKIASTTLQHNLDLVPALDTITFNEMNEQISNSTLTLASRDEPDIKPYKYKFTSPSFFPFIRFDNYNESASLLDNIKLGLYVRSFEMLDKLGISCGAAINRKYERDLFLIFDYKDRLPIFSGLGLDPSITLELYNITRKYDAKFWSYFDSDLIMDTIKATITYSLFEFDFSLTQKIFSDRMKLKFLYTLSRYNQDFGMWRHPNFGYMPAARSTYFIGNALSLQLKYNGIQRTMEEEINPMGRSISLKYFYDIDKFNPKDSAKYEKGFRVPIYTPYNFSRLELTWNEHISLPIPKHTFSVSLNAVGIFKDSIDEFFNYYIGGFIGMRGYPFYAIGGNKAMSINATYRFPISTELNFRLLQFYFKRLYASLFFDIGEGWYNNKIPSSWKKDIGFEIRLESFSYYLYPTRIFFSGAYGLDKFTREIRNVADNVQQIQYGKEWHFYLGVLFDFELTDILSSKFRR